MTDGERDGLIKTLAQRVGRLELERTVLKAAMSHLEKRQAIQEKRMGTIEKKFNVLDANVKQLAAAAEKKGRKKS